MNQTTGPVYNQNKFKKHLNGFLNIFLILFFVIPSIMSCGKKAPPRPPKMLPVPSVSDLDAKRISETGVELTWTIPLKPNTPIPDGFWIYRSKKALDMPQCPECPDEYKKISDVVSDARFREDTGTQFIYYDTIEDGYVYRYRVLAYTQRGLIGNWSNTVEVNTR